MKTKTKTKKYRRPKVGVIKVGSPTQKRWQGWRTFEAPGPVISYNINDLK